MAKIYAKKTPSIPKRSPKKETIHCASLRRVLGIFIVLVFHPYVLLIEPIFYFYTACL